MALSLFFSCFDEDMGILLTYADLCRIIRIWINRREINSVCHDRNRLLHARPGVTSVTDVTGYRAQVYCKRRPAIIPCGQANTHQSRGLRGVYASSQAQKIRASRFQLAHQSTVVTRQILRGFQSTRVCLHTLLPVSSIPEKCRNRQGFSLHEKRVVDTRSVETSSSMLNQLLLSLPYVAMAIPLLLFALRHAFPGRNEVSA